MLESVKTTIVDDFLKSILPRAVAAALAMGIGHLKQAHLDGWGITVDWSLFQAKASALLLFVALTVAHYVEKFFKRDVPVKPAEGVSK